MSAAEMGVVVVVTVWFAALGACFGSLLNVLVYRLPRGLSVIHPPSSCPKCGREIAWYDNVPVFGWLFLRGRCRWCQSPISIRYPVVEAFVTIQWTVVFILWLVAQHRQTGGEWIDAVRAIYEVQSPAMMNTTFGVLAMLYWATGSVLMIRDRQPLPRIWILCGVTAFVIWAILMVRSAGAAPLRDLSLHS